MKKVEFIHGLNAPREQFVQNIERNLKREIDTVKTGRAMLVAGGPSAADHVDDIRRLKEGGWTLYTVNGAHDWLVSLGIVPDYCALMYAGSVVNTVIQKPQQDCIYLLTSQ